VAKHVRTRQADIGLTADTLSLGDLESVAEFSSECVCIGTERWLDPRAGHIHIGEFANKPFIASSGTFQTRLNAWLGANGVQVDAMIEASLFQSISDLCLEGLGIAVVDPMTAAKHQRRGGVALPLHPPISYTVYATAMSDAKLSIPAKELIRLVAAASSAEHITSKHAMLTQHP
jgi:DNA-binding transcriptional LysR family regulator